MKFLSTFKINKGFDRWLKLVDELQPYTKKYELKMILLVPTMKKQEYGIWVKLTMLNWLPISSTTKKL